MKKIKIGIIGTGVGIRTHLSGFKSVETAEVYAISGSNEKRSIEFANKYNIPIACKDYKQLCDIKELDVICITTPNKYHYEMMEYALKKDVNIICEKPVSAEISEIEKLISLSKNNKNIVIVDHQLRYNPYMTRIKEIISNNDLGKIYTIKINQEGVGFSNLNIPWSWSFDGNEYGGVRLAMASHFNDLLQYWFGEVPLVSVSGYLNPVFKKRMDNNIEKRVTGSTVCYAKIDFKDEKCALYSINAGAYDKFKFDIDIYGDKGQLHFDLENKLSIYRMDNKGCSINIDVDGVFQDELDNKASMFSGSFRYFAPCFITAIIENNRNLIDRSAKIEDAKYNATILDAIKISANTGKSIQFSCGENDYV